MEARAQGLLEFIENAGRLEIPIYQRPYSWGIEEIGQLWADIGRIGREALVTDAERTHFIGSVTHIEEEEAGGAGSQTLYLVDGQQRIATVMLLIEAMARAIENGTSTNLDSLPSSEELRRRYLLCKDDPAQPRMQLGRKDTPTFEAILRQKTLPEPRYMPIRDALDRFTRNLIAHSLQAIWRGLSRLRIVVIGLNRISMNPQVVFETLNARGLQLSDPDKIRNFLLFDMEPEEQNALYREHWLPMETQFGQEDYEKNFNDFIHRYLCFKKGKWCNLKKVYETFKEYAEILSMGKPQIAEDLRTFAGYYCNMKLGQEDDPLLKAAFDDLLKLRSGPLTPFLLELYHDYTEKSRLTAGDFEKIARILESYILRRMSRGQTDGNNLYFPRFSSNLDKDRYAYSVAEKLKNAPTSARFPSDEAFEIALLSQHAGELKVYAYILQKIEERSRRDMPNPPGLTPGLATYELERILPLLPKKSNGQPDEDALPDAWKRPIGPNWQEAHERLVNSLGNLTLMPKEFSAKPKGVKNPPIRTFQEKKEAPNGYNNSKLWLNRGPTGPAKAETWSAGAIRKRAEQLAKLALHIWPEP